MVAYSFKQRFVHPIRVGLSRVSLSFDCPPKRQTIRAHGKRRHVREGEMLQLYYAQRTKQCEKIGDAICVSVSDIVIMVRKTSLRISLVDPVQLDDFAQVDGFDDAVDMHAFWKAEHGLGKFEGVLIRWEPLT